MAEPCTPGTWNKNPEEYYNSPTPEVVFLGSRFILTGVFSLEEHCDVEKEIESVGAPYSGIFLNAGVMSLLAHCPQCNR